MKRLRGQHFLAEHGCVYLDLGIKEFKILIAQSQYGRLLSGLPISSEYL